MTQKRTEELIERLEKLERRHGEGCPCVRCQRVLFAANDAYLAAWKRSAALRAQADQKGE